MLYGALIAAMTMVACVALHRGIERRRWLVLLILALYSATALDTLATPGLDAVGQIAARRCSSSPSTCCCPFPRAGSRRRRTRGRGGDRDGSVLVWGVLLITADRLPEFMPAARC